MDRPARTRARAREKSLRNFLWRTYTVKAKTRQCGELGAPSARSRWLLAALCHWCDHSVARNSVPPRCAGCVGRAVRRNKGTHLFSKHRWSYRRAYCFAAARDCRNPSRRQIQEPLRRRRQISRLQARVFCAWFLRFLAALVAFSRILNQYPWCPEHCTWWRLLVIQLWKLRTCQDLNRPLSFRDAAHCSLAKLSSTL
jgi:hypothetical protein